MTFPGFPNPQLVEGGRTPLARAHRSCKRSGTKARGPALPRVPSPDGEAAREATSGRARGGSVGPPPSLGEASWRGLQNVGPRGRGTALPPPRSHTRSRSRGAGSDARWLKDGGIGARPGGR